MVLQVEAAASSEPPQTFGQRLATCCSSCLAAWLRILGVQLRSVRSGLWGVAFPCTGPLKGLHNVLVGFMSRSSPRKPQKSSRSRRNARRRPRVRSGIRVFARLMFCRPCVSTFLRFSRSTRFLLSEFSIYVVLAFHVLSRFRVPPQKWVEFQSQILW